MYGLACFLLGSALTLYVAGWLSINKGHGVDPVAWTLGLVMTFAGIAVLAYKRHKRE